MTAAGVGNVRQPLILLPGIIAPAADRYAPLLHELAGEVDAVPKDLAVYGSATPPPGFSIDAEVADVARAADQAGFTRFHLYGHSGGGAVALAFAAAHPERLITLAVDEPAFDFTPADRADPRREELRLLRTLPVPEMMAAFMSRQVQRGVELPSPPAGPPPAWMALRPAGVLAFIDAAERYRVTEDRYRAFRQPVYYSYGSLSSEEWVERRDRLQALFPRFTAELYDGCHHLRTSHVAEPARVAEALRRLWASAA